jgi:oligoendopeptidase F
VFGEMLTFRKLLDQAKTPAEKKTLLAGKVEDMINTVVRQIAFYDFECKLHAARAEGRADPEDINALWMSVQAQSLATRSSSCRAMRPSGPISRTSSTRPSTSMPMPSATGW